MCKTYIEGPDLVGEIHLRPIAIKKMIFSFTIKDGRINFALTEEDLILLLCE